MRTLIFSLFGFIYLISCQKDDPKLCVVLFPTTLTYDTINIIQTEVYNKSGKLNEYDKKFDEFELPEFGFPNSIRFLNNTSALNFDNLGIYIKVDSLKSEIHENTIQLIPEKLPPSILAIDTKGSAIVNTYKVENMTLIDDVNAIKSALTRTYYLHDDKFILPLFAIPLVGT